MYDPHVGRFMQPDPLIPSYEFSQALNRYAYTYNDPLNLFDPSGYWPKGRDALDRIKSSAQRLGAEVSAAASRAGQAIVGLATPERVSAALDTVQVGLDVASIGLDATGVGAVVSWAPDLANAAISLARGDRVGAGISLLAAAPLIGAAANGTRIVQAAGKTAKIDVADEAFEGIYEFVASNGRRYVGQSNDVPRRIQEHLRQGKLPDGGEVVTTRVSGGKTAREVAEQQRIDELGGIDELANKRNPIGPRRRHLMEDHRR